MEWIIANWSYILSGLFALIVVASVIIKLTPSTSDDSVMNKIITILDKFSIAKTARDKEILDAASKVMAGEDNKESK